MSEEEQGGRIFFSSIGRSMEAEDEIVLVSVGIDIGSSTSHLAFSRIVLERLDTRYIVVERTLLFQSEVLLTPYKADQDIDADVLGEFIAQQYALVKIAPEDIDTGALILTGVAVRRRNARAIGEIFAAQTGKFVVVSAGDGLETTLAAFGSGAVSRSGKDQNRVLNVDIGGGTSKLALCENGKVSNITAIDIGARVVAFDDERRITRIEEAGYHFGRKVGLELALGSVLSPEQSRAIADAMVEQLLLAMKGGDLPKDTLDLHRLPALPASGRPDVVTVSGGVSEFFYAAAKTGFSDLGPDMAESLKAKLATWGAVVEPPAQGIRATVVGASQYTVQVSGSTIFVRPLAALPVRSVPVIKPKLALDDVIDPVDVARAIRSDLLRLDLAGGDSPVAICYDWNGSATYGRLDAFCRGVADGFTEALGKGHPLILVGDNDVGGLIGMHCHLELAMEGVISIDGVQLAEFDFIDIGAMLEASGAVPVVVKSLVFPELGLGGGAQAGAAD